MHLHKDDQVLIIGGKDRGKRGRILRIDHKQERVVVEGINLVKKAMRKQKQDQRGGLVEIEAPLHVSNVSACTKDGKKSRIGIRVERGRKVRYLKKSGEAYDGGS